MPGTTSTALPSFSHDQRHKTDAAKRKGVVALEKVVLTGSIMSTFHKNETKQQECIKINIT